MRFSDARSSIQPGHQSKLNAERVDDRQLTCLDIDARKELGRTTTTRRVCVTGLLSITVFAMISVEPANAFYRYRQYYGSWSYNPIQTYYYRPYYYLPYSTATTYSYHYVVCYPSQPRYYYYYNPVRNYYWGRYDLKEKGYSLLAEKDRKKKLEDIREDAFPKPGKMPNIPDAKDDVAMEVAPADVPKEPPAEATKVVSAGEK
jgi:hypothetical protein